MEGIRAQTTGAGQEPVGPVPTPVAPAGGPAVERRGRERRAALLARAATAVAEAAGARESFDALTRMVVPELADSCVVHLVRGAEEDDVGTPLVVEHVAAAAADGLPQNLPATGEAFVAPGSPFARAVHGRLPVHATFAPGAIPATVAPPGTVPWTALAGAHTMALVPVLVDGAVVAVAGAFGCGEREGPGPDEMDLLRDLLAQAHAPLGEALRLQRARRTALVLQRSLLAAPPRLPGLESAARYRPTRAAAGVAGDWYDAFVLGDGSVALAVGDVTGHGLQAAVTMGRMRSILGALAVDRQESAAGVVQRLDAAARRLDAAEAPVTCVYGRVTDTGEGARRLQYTVAGHPPPLLVAGPGEADFLTGAPNPSLGLPASPPERTGAEEELPAGSTLVLYTDGLVERPGEEIGHGLERLRQRAAGTAGEPLEAFCDALLQCAHPAGRDDVALIAVRVPAGPG